MRALCYLVAGLLALSSANAQSSGNLGTIGPIHRGLAVGAIVGVTAVGGVAITYLVLHNRGVAAGCIAESGGKKTLVGSDKKVSILLDKGASLPVGERVKLKGHKAGPASAPSFQVEKVLKDYGPCPP